MRVVVGADHAGYRLKEAIKGVLREMRCRVTDVGTHSTKPVDYPEYAEKVGLAVRRGQARRGVVTGAPRRGLSGASCRGILVCGSGVGACVAANKLPGIRAGLCHDAYSAHQGVEHDDMNVLVLGGRVIGGELAKDLVRTFLAARFTGETRHRRRLKEVAALEKKYACEGCGEHTSLPNAERRGRKKARRKSMDQGRG